ncbi:IS3 family transposase [Enterococcus italicus]|uniref:IS3 family transposase n=1 Tax=Enterococcus italicus TaxID=246144 RepID=UPI00255CDB7E|nr:IS3 family transposase [Enterococcus italicus]
MEGLEVAEKFSRLRVYFYSAINNYIHWYNNQRIKLSLGGLSPLQYRKKQGFIC